LSDRIGIGMNISFGQGSPQYGGRARIGKRLARYILAPLNNMPLGISQKCQPPTAPWRGLLHRLNLLKRIVYLWYRRQPIRERFAPTRSGADISAKSRLNQRFLFILLAVLLMPTSAMAAPKTIVAFGDSLTQGYGLPQGDGLVPQLQAWLDRAGADVRVLNAGVSGDTTAGGLSRIDWTLTPDVDAIIVNLGGNDILRGIAPETARANLDGVLAAITAKGLPVLLVGLDPPTNFGPAFKDGYDRLYPELAAKYGALFYASYLGTLMETGDRAQVLKTLMQPDAIHPNADGVKAIVKVLGPKVLDLIERIE
jgi:acyl-CoA thioesterase I